MQCTMRLKLCALLGSFAGFAGRVDRAPMLDKAGKVLLVDEGALTVIV